MRRWQRFLTMAITPFLLAFLGGCSKPVGEVHNNESRDRGASPPSNESKRTGESAARDADGQVALTLSVQPKNVGESTDSRPRVQAAISLVGDTELAVGSGSRAASAQQTLWQADGATYTGEVSDGKPNGQGTLTDPHGTNQQGEWHDGQPYRVSGTWVAPDGTREVGTWNHDGAGSGGTITWKDGREYKGDWKIVDGAPEVPDGVGAMSWPDGRKYVGEFREGKMNGTGKLTYPDGRVEDGSWKQSKFTGATK